MTSTFSNIAFKITIATGLAFGVGVCAAGQIVSSFTQSSLLKLDLGVKPPVDNVFMQPSDGTKVPATTKFIPKPNPEPIGTGGTGTR